jgi:xanthine dehydrogenase accessory factor
VRFPNTILLHDWPNEALATLAPDRRTAILTLTHDPKIDDPALEAALRSEAFYIGALGSRRTHAKRVERLKNAGFDAAAIARIHGPVGLPIGAQTPAEIAISIMAEITAVLRRAPLAQRA